MLSCFYLPSKHNSSNAVQFKIIKRIDLHIKFHLKCTIVPWVIKRRHSIWFTMLKQFGVRFFFCFSNNRSFKDKNPMTFSRVIWNLGQNVTVLPDGFLHKVTGDSKSMVNRV